MLYTSKKRSFKNFIKSRNNIFYIAILLIFIVVIVVTATTISRRNRKTNKPINDNYTVSPDETDSNDTTIVENDLEGSYDIKINISNNQITIYDKETNSKVREMLCSFSEDIKEGSYNADTSKSFRMTWYGENDSIYRYYTDFGNIITFHSARYSEKLNKNSLIAEEYNNIGKENIENGITLTIEDAKWIFEHCANESTITVFSNDTLDTTIKLIVIPDGITWDPTDYSEGTPWSKTPIKSLDCPEKIDVFKGSTSAVIYEKIVAKNIDDKDISKYVNISGDYNLNVPGDYLITLQIVDTAGNHLVKQAVLSVIESIEETTEDTTTEKILPTTEVITTELSTSEASQTVAPTTEESTTETPTTVIETTAEEETTTEE